QPRRPSAEPAQEDHRAVEEAGEADAPRESAQHLVGGLGIVQSAWERSTLQEPKEEGEADGEADQRGIGVGAPGRGHREVQRIERERIADEAGHRGMASRREDRRERGGNEDQGEGSAAGALVGGARRREEYAVEQAREVRDREDG